MVSVYDPLKAFWEAQPGKTIQLWFGQIETILNRSLPTAAHHHDWWWANEDVEETRHVQCKSWQSAGWQVSAIDRRNRIVRGRDSDGSGTNQCLNVQPRRTGITIPFDDLLIGACALERGYAIATRNPPLPKDPRTEAHPVLARGSDREYTTIFATTSATYRRAQPQPHTRRLNLR